MSDLQISLLAIGALVVGAVYLFNWMQERKLRHRLEKVFPDQHADILLDTVPVAADTRIEPQLQPVTVAAPDALRPPSTPAPAPAGGVPGLPPVEDFDDTIDYVARIEADTVISDSIVDDLLARGAAFGKRLRCAGFNAATGQWEVPERAGGSRYSVLAVALQLVDRTGVISPAQLSALGDTVQYCASRATAEAVLPDVQVALATARDLDQFCSEVDVAIGVNVVAEEVPAFSGTKIRMLAEAAGFKLESEGVFHFRDGQRRTLFTIDNHEPAPFIPEQVKSLSTTGITLLLDVPRVADGRDAFDRMLEIGRHFAQALGGRLVDDNRVALSETGIAKIREQLGKIHASMDRRGINAGGARALRLFS